MATSNPYAPRPTENSFASAGASCTTELAKNDTAVMITTGKNKARRARTYRQASRKCSRTRPAASSRTTVRGWIAKSAPRTST